MFFWAATEVAPRSAWAADAGPVAASATREAADTARMLRNGRISSLLDFGRPSPPDDGLSGQCLLVHGLSCTVCRALVQGLYGTTSDADLSRPCLSPVQSGCVQR